MNGLEKRLRERIKRFDYPIDITEHDLNARYLIGWPGYRNARDKSGLGYVETQAELAHMRGLMLRWLVTGKFITHNPIFLLLMFMYGLFIGGLPLVFILMEVFVAHNYRILPFVMPFAIHISVGVLLIVNVVISLFNPGAKSITGD